MPTRSLLKLILSDYALPLDGDHGVSHWARVLENGQRLAGETGADPLIVSLFAVLHDCRRENEWTDPEHGLRAAIFATQVRSELPVLSEDQFQLLYDACAGHTHGRTHSDATVQTCWDADRLDLGRVGITPHPRYLCTEVARRSETINWAHGRASFHFVPRLVHESWGIDLGR